MTDNDDSTQCDEPLLYVPVVVLEILWMAVYWVSFVSCWVVYPICQSYVVSGQFDKWRRFRSALRDNVLLYVIAGAIGGAVLVTMQVQGVFGNGTFLDVLMALANAWGVLLIVAFLGHGLVEVPRQMYYNSNLRRQLTTAYWRVAHLYHVQEKADDKFDIVLNEIIDVRRQLHPDDPLGDYLKRVIEHCPPDLDHYSGGRHEPIKKRGFWSRIGKILRGGSGDDKGSGGSDEYPTYERLTSINARVMQGSHVSKSAHRAFEDAVADAVWLADVVAAVEDKSATRIERSDGTRRTHRLAALFDRVELFWYRWLRRSWFWFMFLLLTALSLTIFWCEISLAIPNDVADLSPLSLMYKEITHNGVGMQLLVAIPLTHMCVSAFISVFQLRLWDFYALRRGKQTDAASLFFCGALFNRLTAPLAYNFLNMLNAADKDNVTFARVVADMNAVPVLGHGFVYWVPCVVCLFGLLTLANVWSRCVSVCGNCGGQRLAFDESTGQVDSTTSVGRDIVEMERRELRENAGLSAQTLSRGIVPLEAELTPAEKKAARHKRFAEVRNARHREAGLDVPMREFGPRVTVIKPTARSSSPPAPPPFRPSSAPPISQPAAPSKSPALAPRATATPARPSKSPTLAPRKAEPAAAPAIVSHAKPADKKFVNDTVNQLLSPRRGPARR